MFPPAPARLRIRTGWPSRAANPGWIIRAITSVGPPGAAGTTILTGALGQPSCARAGRAITIGAANRARRDTLIVILAPSSSHFLRTLVLGGHRRVGKPRPERTRSCFLPIRERAAG